MAHESPENHEFQSLELSFVGSLLPGFLHNISTPLSGVIGATQLMEMRVSDQDKLLERLKSANSQASAELVAHMEKNKTNLQIIERNATQLISIVQVLVQRFQRLSVRGKIPQSLTELVNNELEFLKANLVFKHKVRKEIQLADEPFAVSFVYAHVVAVIDEFVSHVIEAHDAKQGMINMSFATAFDDNSGRLDMASTYVPFAGVERGIDSFGIFLARLRQDGCDYRFDSALGETKLTLIVPR